MMSGHILTHQNDTLLLGSPLAGLSLRDAKDVVFELGEDRHAEFFINRLTARCEQIPQRARRNDELDRTRDTNACELVAVRGRGPVPLSRLELEQIETFHD